MKVFRTVLLSFILSLILAENIQAQELKQDEVVVLKGEKFVLHQVRTGETIYSITKDYNLSRAELIKLNPEISEGLDIGQIVKIPYRKGTSLNQKDFVSKGDPSSFKLYKIPSRRETPYFIAKKFNITVEELYAYNPTVRKFKKGKTIRIPVWEKIVQEEVVIQEPEVVEGEMRVHTVVSGESLYSISKMYGVSESEILFYNPGTSDLKAGSKLTIPVQKEKVIEYTEEPITKSEQLYFEHIIESGETMWGMTRKYNVTEQELKELNPALRTAFPAGVVIKIPLKNEVETTQAKPVNDDAFYQHQVLSGETLWGLAHEYNLKIPDIKKYNPILESRNLVAGETILIPKKIPGQTADFEPKNKTDSMEQVEAFYEVELPIEVPDFCQPNEFAPYYNETYNVALFLPLYLEANDTLNRETEMQNLLDSIALAESNVDENLVNEIAQDTMIERDEPKELFKQFYGGSENYIQFYEGVLIAMDEMQKTGMKIVLNVYDTQRNADSIRQIIYTEEFLETDLIIGPVLQSVQEDVARIAAKNRIPIVSPLASQSDITVVNPHYFQVIPTREYIAEKTAEMVAEEYFNSNFIVLKTRDYEGTVEGEMVELIQEKMFNSGFLSQQNGVNFTIYDFEKEGSFGLRRIMSKRKENVVLIPSMNEGELSVAISNVNNLADDFSITLIGSHRY